MFGSVKLYVMRHGPAEDTAATGRDEDRALTASGRDRVRNVVKLLQREGEMPGRILASRLVRAHQTAEIVAAAAKAAGWRGTVETVAELAPGGKNVALCHALVRAHGSDAAGPMLVGHEPDLSSLIDDLLGSPMPLTMDKAMVDALELGDDGAATLRFILEPRAVAVVHDARMIDPP